MLEVLRRSLWMRLFLIMGRSGGRMRPSCPMMWMLVRRMRRWLLLLLMVMVMMGIGRMMAVVIGIDIGPFLRRRRRITITALHRTTAIVSIKILFGALFWITALRPTVMKMRMLLLLLFLKILLLLGRIGWQWKSSSRAVVRIAVGIAIGVAMALLCFGTAGRRTYTMLVGRHCPRRR